MLLKTHLIITLFFVLVFVSEATNKTEFVIIALLSTLIPDIDTRFSRIGKSKLLRIFQFFVRHRGIIHSFTFAGLLTLIFALVFPAIAFPFFLGYSLHLLADTLTIKGIRWFYPARRVYSWRVKTGGKTEMIIFFFFLMLDIYYLFNFVV